MFSSKQRSFSLSSSSFLLSPSSSLANSASGSGSDSKSDSKWDSSDSSGSGSRYGSAATAFLSAGLAVTALYNKKDAKDSNSSSGNSNSGSDSRPGKGTATHPRVRNPYYLTNIGRAVKLTPKEQLPVEHASIAFAPHVPPPIARSHQAKVVVPLSAGVKVMSIGRGEQKFEFWPFDGAVPGPIFRARVGDVLCLSLRNDDPTGMEHNLDVHAVSGPGGGSTVLTSRSGETTAAEFRLLYPGFFVYHCAVGPIGVHIGRGMYGACIVEPEEGLPPVDKEFFIMQSEIYADLPTPPPPQAKSKPVPVPALAAATAAAASIAAASAAAAKDGPAVVFSRDATDIAATVAASKVPGATTAGTSKTPAITAAAATGKDANNGKAPAAAPVSPAVASSFDADEDEDEDDPNLVGFDYEAGQAEKPRLVVFNGRDGSLRNEGTLKVDLNDRVRVYFANAGPNLVSSLHVIGAVMENVYRDGDLASPPARAVQVTPVASGGAAVFELDTRVPGTLTLVDHSIFRTEKGAVGFIEVGGGADCFNNNNRVECEIAQKRKDEIAELFFAVQPPRTCESCNLHP